MECLTSIVAKNKMNVYFVSKANVDTSGYARDCEQYKTRCKK